MIIYKRPNVVGGVWIGDLGISLGDSPIDLSLQFTPDVIRKSFNSGGIRKAIKRGWITATSAAVVTSPPPPTPKIPAREVISIPVTEPVEPVVPEVPVSPVASKESGGKKPARRRKTTKRKSTSKKKRLT